MPSLFVHCRAGFEADCAAELQARASPLGIHGWCKAPDGAAWMVFQPGGDEAETLHRTLPVRDLTFARQAFVSLALCREMPRDDRVAPLVRTLREAPAAAGELFLERPDTDAGKVLAGLARALAGPLRGALQQAGLLAGEPARRLHVCLLDGATAYAGYALTACASAWPMGVPRLRMPRAAPSRSTLKLEEALLTFLTAEERERELAPGMRAVDLGAAPGGWTWQLVRRHLHVTAVDNGPMDDGLMESGLVDHVRANGLRYRPPAPVDWMVCDMVEQPMRVADVAARWLADGSCRHAVFNLKLPMKRRYQEVVRCLGHIREVLADAGVTGGRLMCKQLYHDREEVTALASGSLAEL